MFPTDSLRSTNETEVKLLYDDTHIYISAYAKGVDANFMVSSLKRDFSARSNDNVTVLFDTFRDGQNAFLFGVSAYGVQREGLVSDRGVTTNGFSLTWDIKWKAETVRNEDSFTIETAIPLNSLKYPEGSQRWGFSPIGMICKQTREVLGLLFLKIKFLSIWDTLENLFLKNLLQKTKHPYI